MGAAARVEGVIYSILGDYQIAIYLTFNPIKLPLYFPESGASAVPNFFYSVLNRYTQIR